ncbi:glycosyltransferase family 39 protein [Phormidium sp. FACHB-592]|uniref:Glycosyltransferase family 39 protein n=1 Tax=Stenomitos frigidus AS-A4 TaxID=2933935 RepID=A0ABV0KN36_9CYAN|nr:glycosyltransferase family 39 protein [Phormidium sp. FACHB-592]MBD2074413.1 glycosyltransferase family 39 protein [Phormidium sp. FACHB-592]
MKHRFSRRFWEPALPGVPQDAIVLGSLWVISSLVTCMWLWLDHAVPSWDDSAHLSGALGYWQILQKPDLFSDTWWTTLWQKAPSYRAPFVYIATVPFLNLFGLGADQAILVNLLFSAILMLSVYQMGQHLFDRQTGIWAAGLCLLFPELATLQTHYLLDYGITALVAFTFAGVTLWRDAHRPQASWVLSVIWGVSFGVIMLAKATSFLFFVFPALWLLVKVVRDRRWLKLLQAIVALLIAWLVCGAWYRLNWLTIITSAITANGVGVAEGDPGFRTLEGWLYYWKALPASVSYPLLLVPIGCFLAGWLLQTVRYGRSQPVTQLDETDGVSEQQQTAAGRNLRWLAVFYVGGYIFCSLSTNKDTRFITPLLPILALILAYGLTRWRYRWVAGLRWATAIVSIVLLLLSWFPIAGLATGTKNAPDRGAPLPHEQVIAAVAEAAPYLRSTIGMVPNTAQINPFNMDFYGRLAAFQVYTRELMSSRSNAQDVRSMSWYLTKSGQLGAAEKDSARQALQAQIEQNPALELHRSWTLPNNEQLRLYHRQTPPIAVEVASIASDKVKLEAVTLLPSAAPNAPLPVVYQWGGSWEQLQQGIVILTWYGKTQPEPLLGKEARWFHDHGIGLGQLYAGDRTVNPKQEFRIVERLAMVPPSTLAAPYRLEAVYLNRQTGETYPLSVPPIRIGNTSAIKPLIEPDLTVQLYQLGEYLAQGQFDAVMQQVGRLNLYDPIGDYLVQAEQALTYRLQQEPQNQAIAYPLALSQALQRRVQPTLKTLEYLTGLDAQNPHLWMYLGIVRLYDWQGQAAEQALNMAEQLQPLLPDLKIMRAIAAAMQLNLSKTLTLL